MEPEPEFVKELTDTSVKYRTLCFPSEHQGILPSPVGNPSDPVAFPVQCGNEVRTFRWRKRRRGPPKLVIQSGWSSLVQDRGLQIGDELQFYRKVNNDGATRYWIKIYRYEYHNDDMDRGGIKNRIV